eukprot:scaffold14973_cov155-Isochrysis_galbana.AAC.2
MRGVAQASRRAAGTAECRTAKRRSTGATTSGSASLLVSTLGASTRAWRNFRSARLLVARSVQPHGPLTLPQPPHRNLTQPTGANPPFLGGLCMPAAAGSALPGAQRPPPQGPPNRDSSQQLCSFLGTRSPLDVPHDDTIFGRCRACQALKHPPGG